MAENKHIAAEIRDIATASIDPESTVNVRRSEVEKGVERVKASIAEHGFWRNNPITLRPHPDSSSEFMYQVIIGQCRLKACMELGIEQVPAVIQEMDDDEAIRRSWAENEGRSEITPSDKAYWVKEIMTRHFKEGKTVKECREIAAKFFAMSIPTVIRYYPMGFLPPEVMTMVDDGILRIQDAEAIAKSKYPLMDSEATEQKMKERAEWMATLDPTRRDAAVKAIGEKGSEASIDQLNRAIEERLSRETARVEVAIVIPEALHGKLLQWGEQQGLAGVDEVTIISHMITVTLRNM